MSEVPYILLVELMASKSAPDPESLVAVLRSARSRMTDAEYAEFQKHVKLIVEGATL